MNKTTTISLSIDALALVNDLSHMLGRTKSEVIILVCTTFKERNGEKIQTMRSILESFQ